MRQIEAQHVAMACPQVGLPVRLANNVVLAFYRRLGCAINDAVALGKRRITDPVAPHGPLPAP